MKRKKNNYVVWITLLITLFSYIIFFILLFIADAFHEEIEKFVIFFLQKDNYFSGEVWLTVAFSMIIAIPGIICGVFALLQTQRLHQLEARYHRPLLGLVEASMKVVWLKDKQCKTITENYQRDKFEKQVREGEQDFFKGNLMSFNLDIEIKNDSSVLSIIPEQIEFIFEKETYIMKFFDIQEEWKQYRTCRMDYKNNMYLYHIIWECFPYSVELKQDEGNVGREDPEKQFWKSIEMFTNFENRRDQTYYQLITKVSLKVYYEYIKEYEIATGMILWEANDGLGRYKSEATRFTRSFIFTYSK